MLFFSKNFALIAGVVVFSLALCFVIMAWTEPSVMPPDSNVAAPVNIGGDAQIKSGDLRIGNGLTIASTGTAFVLEANDGTYTGDKLTVGQDGNVIAAVQLTAPMMCFGDNCRSKWVAGTCEGDGNYMKGIDTEGNIICSGVDPTPPPCSNECNPEGQTCSILNSAVDCSDSDGDGCTELTNTPCESHQKCDAGVCVGVCTLKDAGEMCWQNSECCSGSCVCPMICMGFKGYCAP